MKRLALVTATLVGPLGAFAQGATELETLRARCSEQERQIVQLETKVDHLNSIIERNQRQSITNPKVNTTPIASSQTGTSTNYIVQKGDSISKIAKHHKTSAQAIISANKLENAGIIAIGQKLIIPTAQPTKKSTTSDQPSKALATSETKGTETKQTTTLYKVKTGDTLYKISRNSGLSVSQLLKANPGINANRLAVGQTIKLTNTTGSPSSKAVKKAPSIAKAKPTAPKPAPKKASTPKPTPKPAPKVAAQAPKEQTVHSAQNPTSVRAVKVDKQITFGDFCKAHGVTVDQVNELNGHALTKSQYLAKGSELYVPSTQH